MPVSFMPFVCVPRTTSPNYLSVVEHQQPSEEI